MTFRPKIGSIARAAATLRYLVEPKLQRVRREIRVRRGGRVCSPEEDRFRI
jgi:hypothetical protein